MNDLSDQEIEKLLGVAEMSADAYSRSAEQKRWAMSKPHGEYHDKASNK
jgi:hypothetical protein